VVPVPVRVSVATAFDALLVTERVALKVPVAVGVNLTLMGALCPAATVTGRLEIEEKAFVDTAMAETVSDAEPELAAFTVRVLLEPVVTLPKLIGVFPRERVPTAGGGAGAPALTP
jgi:hypothetical protein